MVPSGPTAGELRAKEPGGALKVHWTAPERVIA